MFLSYLRPIWYTPRICGQRQEHRPLMGDYSKFLESRYQIKSHNSSASNGQVYRFKEEQNKNYNERKRGKNIIISTYPVPAPWKRSVKVTRVCSLNRSVTIRSLLAGRCVIPLHLILWIKQYPFWTCRWLVHVCFPYRSVIIITLYFLPLWNAG